MKKSIAGFTIVELLVVIVVIGILASVSVVAYSGIQNRAKDAQRAQDFDAIYKALVMYDTANGHLKRTYGAGSFTGDSHHSGWNTSLDSTWLAFLRPEFGTMPVDPNNIIASGDNPTSSGSRAYFYYCYDPGDGALPGSPNVRIGYRKSDNTLVTKDFVITACRQ